MAKKINLKNQTFGEWTVLEKGPNTGPNKNITTWLCRCSCGTTKNVSTCALKQGQSKKCIQCSPNAPLPVGESNFNILLNIYKRNALKKKRSFDLTDEEFRYLISLPCQYCGVPPCNTHQSKYCRGTLQYNGIDRVDSSLPYTRENSVTCCETCNRAKRDLSKEEFLSWAKRLSAYQASLT